MLNPGTSIICVREIQDSVDQSVKKEIVGALDRYNLRSYFEVQDKLIKTPGGGNIVFKGMQDHTAKSVKSMSGFKFAWVDEAANLSNHSLEVLDPTIRMPGSQIWFSWNPEDPEDPVDAFFRGPNAPKDDPDYQVVQSNWRDNPWFPETLDKVRRDCLKYNPDIYDHIWEGGYRTIADAQIFRGRYVVEEFDTPDDVRFYFGADFGYAKDPSTLIRCFIKDRDLYIDYEAGGTGIELDEIPDLYDSVPGSRTWPIKADCSQPGLISHIKRKGFNITAAEKWAGSIEDGLSYLKGFRRIIIHPRCQQTAREFRLYSYKVDKHTSDVLPIIVDADNHYIDALRYSQDGLVKGRGPLVVSNAAMSRLAPQGSGYRRR
jgi:phage terminase large subunit